jgi:hypothetical protein
MIWNADNRPDQAAINALPGSNGSHGTTNRLWALPANDLDSPHTHRVLGMSAAKEAANMPRGPESTSCGGLFFACQTLTMQRPQY